MCFCLSQNGSRSFETRRDPKWTQKHRQGFKEEIDPRSIHGSGRAGWKRKGFRSQQGKSSASNVGQLMVADAESV